MLPIVVALAVVSCAVAVGAVALLRLRRAAGLLVELPTPVRSGPLGQLVRSTDELGDVVDRRADR